MKKKSELRFFPELAHLPLNEQQEKLAQAKKLAFGHDAQLLRWRGNIIYFALMFTFSAIFMMEIAPALALTQEISALLMMIVVLPIFFLLQQRRYIQLIRQSLVVS